MLFVIIAGLSSVQLCLLSYFSRILLEGTLLTIKLGFIFFTELNKLLWNCALDFIWSQIDSISFHQDIDHAVFQLCDEERWVSVLLNEK